MPSSVKISPCPFCGEKATVEKSNICNLCVISCKKCYSNGGAVQTKWHNTKHDAIMAWNKNFR